MRLWIFAAVIGLWHWTSLPLAADEVEDAKHFQAVHAQLAKVLPKGWTIKSELSAKGEGGPFQLRGSPRLIISSDTPLQIGPIGANAPLFLDEDDIYEPNIVNVRLFVAPSITQAEFDRLELRNTESLERRDRFAKERAKQPLYSPNGYLHPDKLPASTVEQRQIQLEYSLLLMQTEPIDLPTYRYHSLTFEAWGYPIDFKDKTKSEEYRKIYDELDRILTRYKERPEWE